jgi:hypothetical protein
VVVEVIDIVDRARLDEDQLVFVRLGRVDRETDDRLLGRSPAASLSPPPPAFLRSAWVGGGGGGRVGGLAGEFGSCVGGGGAYCV